jgi:hypothetical protein
MADVTEGLTGIQAMIFLLASDVYRITKNALQKYEYCKLGVF